MHKNTLVAIIAVTLLTIAFSLGVALGYNVEDNTVKEKEISINEVLY